MDARSEYPIGDLQECMRMLICLQRRTRDRIILLQGMVGLFRRLTWSEAALLEDDGSH